MLSPRWVVDASACIEWLAATAPGEVLAAGLHRRHKLASPDVIVHATAQRHGAEPLACDDPFKGLGVVLQFDTVTSR